MKEIIELLEKAKHELEREGGSVLRCDRFIVQALSVADESLKDKPEEP